MFWEELHSRTISEQGETFGHSCHAKGVPVLTAKLLWKFCCW